MFYFLRVGVNVESFFLGFVSKKWLVGDFLLD